VTVNQPAVPSVHLDPHQVKGGPLPERISMEPVTAGAPYADELTLLDGPDGFFALWACDAGVYPRVKDRRGSFMYILSGDATITDADGTSHELTADSVLVLPYAWEGTWHIRETIRKVYLHTTPVPPLPGAPVPCAFAPAEQVRRPLPPGGQEVLFDGPDGRCAVRAHEPGSIPPTEPGRAVFLQVLDGEATLTDSDGTSHELTEGSAAALPCGWTGTWQVRRTLRTLTIHSTPRQDTP
jgi:uncharacterized cupin superfamily protein